MEYKDQLQHIKWKKKRIEILERDKYTCMKCGFVHKTNEVHHLSYKFGSMAWEYDNDWLITLCSKCHEDESYNVKILYFTIKQALLSGLWAEEIIAKIDYKILT